MNLNNVLLIKVFSAFGVCLFFLSYVMFREDVGMPRTLFFITSSELLVDKSSFYRMVTGFLSGFLSERHKVISTLTDPSCLYLNMPTCIWLPAKVQLYGASYIHSLLLSASQFVFTLHAGSMPVRQAPLSLRIIQYVLAAPSDMSFQCTVFTPPAT